MQEHDRGVIHSSEESNWRTPPACFQALAREFHFVVDLAADHTATLTKDWYGPGSPYAENALTAAWPSWGSDGLTSVSHVSCFLNPPFSRTLANAYRTGRIKQDGQWVDHPRDPELAKVYAIESWAEKCWQESRKGATIVGIFPFAPQTDWYLKYIYGIDPDNRGSEQWLGHAAREERRLPHRISFLRPDGQPAGNAGVNSVIISWTPNPGYVGPWQPAQRYWSYR